MCEALMFKDAFWSSEFMCHVGYETMIQRLRDGRQMCKDVEELLRMRALAEEKYGRELVTLARKAGGHTEISTLRTSFEQLKSQIENVGNFHIQLSDILKEEVRKIDVFRERQKEQRRKFQSIMEKLQKKKICLYKKTMESKKIYEQRCKDATEADRGAERTGATSKTPDKIRQRAKQYRQMAKEAEKLYLTNVKELDNARHDWEETHRSTCEVFQQMEGDRIRMLRCALWDHCNHFSMQCVKDDEYFEEVRRVLERCDITREINCFIQMKTTGSRPPEPILFEICHWMETSTNGNCQSYSLADDTTRSFNPVLASSSGSISVSSLQNPHTSLTSTDQQASEGAYAPLRFKPSPARSRTDEEIYTVLYEYNAQDSDELSVSQGEVVQVLDRGEDGWWTVETNGRTGLVPGTYLEKQRGLANTENLL